MPPSSFRKIIVETTPTVLMAISAELFAGIFLYEMHDYLALFPGILLILPGMMELRGNISSGLGFRLGSAIHLGIIERFDLKNPNLVENIKANIALNVITAFLLGHFVYFYSLLTGLKTISYWFVLFIAIFTSLVSGILLTFFTIFVALYGFKKGLDPDNITVPAVATVGDMLTILILYLEILLMNLLNLKAIFY